ncbi:MAG: hypothetical protein AAF192_06910 [Pseudomonadota bacterium]
MAGEPPGAFDCNIAKMCVEADCVTADQPVQFVRASPDDAASWRRIARGSTIELERSDFGTAHRFVLADAHSLMLASITVDGGGRLVERFDTALPEGVFVKTHFGECSVGADL